MSWVSLSFCTSGWHSAGPILPINPEVRLQILQKLYCGKHYIFILDSYQECSLLPSEPDESVIIYWLRSCECSLSSFRSYCQGVNWNALIHLLRRTTATQTVTENLSSDGKINAVSISSHTLTYRQANVKGCFFFLKENNKLGNCNNWNRLWRLQLLLSVLCC